MVLDGLRSIAKSTGVSYPNLASPVLSIINSLVTQFNSESDDDSKAKTLKGFQEIKGQVGEIQSQLGILGEVVNASWHNASHPSRTEMILECENCDRVFTNRSHLNAHCCYPRKCILCNKMFDKRDNYRRHKPCADIRKKTM